MLTFIEHEEYYKHKMPHILENPRRLKVIMKALTDGGFFENPNVKKESPEAAVEEDVKTIHSDQLVDTVKHGSMLGVTEITGDTITNEFTYKAALRAIGGAKLAADLLVKNATNQAYLLARPPGHHATKRNAMGFCFFNNIAFAANYLVTRKKLKKVAVIDIDNHYGNGTADLFYDRNDIMTISLHVDPRFSFPYQGRITEIGEREGEGYNICLPLPVLTGDQEYLLAFEEVVPSILRQYNPDLILVAMGYDSLQGDPYGHLALTPYYFQVIMNQIKNLANELCNGKLLMTLEGGYKFDELAQAFLASVSPFIPKYDFDKNPDSKLSSSGSKNMIKAIIAELKSTMKSYWSFD
ncbi:MAG: histone deacetylase [Asgard group archaeon]|nr:histone deacetylase [Asgard group archaeon]